MKSEGWLNAVTELYGRTFATWTLTTCALCLICAKNPRFLQFMVSASVVTVVSGFDPIEYSFSEHNAWIPKVKVPHQ